jgi:hypothetical protein
MKRIIVLGGRYWCIAENPPVEFGAYLATSQGLLLVDRVLHCADTIVVDCVRASEESETWASGLLAVTGVTSYQLVEIQPVIG